MFENDSHDLSNAQTVRERQVISHSCSLECLNAKHSLGTDFINIRDDFFPINSFISNNSHNSEETSQMPKNRAIFVFHLEIFALSLTCERVLMKAGILNEDIRHI